MDFWSELIGTQTAPPPPVVLVTGALALVVVLSHTPWRLARNIITIVHEAGHAVIAVLAGRRLSGIRLHSDTSGVTVSRGRPTGPGMVFTSLAGYIAPSLVGLGFAALLGTDRITLLLWVCTAVLLAMLIMVRNVYGALLLLVTGAVLVSVSLLTTSGVQAAFAYLITWFLLVGGVRPVSELQRKRSRGRARDSDADQLARLTSTPAITWVLVFFVVTLGSLGLGTTWMLTGILF
ncbi:M50 family metallopeptidase [Allokutzneria sp. A3M-2-11 16]|uniref:M50 family metallopeptidase n=1 Tax=Allokutzneria sp. A3M-2-11 16 TaxID=2962043 RepID=UPI0020B663B9|nr:M50 family metallopeptidase [Allokutzneria sp. A3M-2-11 16]MCP3800936.1 M50 family metallopeptidase [Allokutzneria sp. A3M-2-11 16]